MTSLPAGFRVRLSDGVRVGGKGQVLTGGSPLRVLFPGAAARGLLATGSFSVHDGTSAELAEKLLSFGMAEPVAAPLAAPAGPAVTFVVPVRDRPDSLRRLLASIGPGERVVVVDDASRSPGQIAEAAAFFGADYVHLTVNAGPAAARNAGLAQVRTPFVAFVDSDMVLEPGTVDALLRHFADPGVALAAPRILGWNPDNEAGWICRYEDSRSSLDLGRRPALVHPRGTVSWLPAACLVGRVEALGGGFSAELRVAEDVDLIWNLVRRGWRVRYDSSVAARHEHRRELGAWLARKMFYGTGAHELFLRHGANVAPAVLAPWSAAFLLALLAQRRWSLPVAAGLAATATVRLSRRVKRSPTPLRLSSALVGQGILAALGQGSALLLRHWWPLAAAGCLFSARLRRAVLLAGVADAAVEYVRTTPRLDPLRFAAARRLDDLAYGAGVWFGALRGRSAGALLPEITGIRRRPRRRGE